MKIKYFHVFILIGFHLIQLIVIFNFHSKILKSEKLEGISFLTSRKFCYTLMVKMFGKVEFILTFPTTHFVSKENL